MRIGDGDAYATPADAYSRCVQCCHAHNARARAQAGAAIFRASERKAQNTQELIDQFIANQRTASKRNKHKLS